MHISVSNVDLSRELNLLEKIVGKKPTISVLANVLVRAGDGQLSMATTDLEIGLISGCNAIVEEPGAITLPARKLMELVRAQSHDRISLQTTSKGAVLFTSGKFAATLQALPASDFVGIPNSDGLPTLAIPRDGLKEAITQIRFAISDKDSRYYTKGGYIAFTQDQLTLVATDSARITIKTLPRVGEPRESLLVPASCLDELSALLAEPGNGDVLFSQSDRHVFFDVDARLLISRQVDGKFPAFERFIPQDNEHVMQVPREEFASVLKRMVLINDTLRLTLRRSTLGSVLGMSSTNAQIGEGVEEIETDYTGPDLDFAFKGAYLLEFANAATGAHVTLALKDSATPVLFTDGNYRYVVMGMRT